MTAPNFPQTSERAASTPLAGLIRQFTRLGIAAGVAALVAQGVPEELAKELGMALELGLLGTILPTLAAIGKVLRNKGNALGEIL